MNYNSSNHNWRYCVYTFFFALRLVPYELIIMHMGNVFVSLCLSLSCSLRMYVFVRLTDQSQLVLSIDVYIYRRMFTYVFLLTVWRAISCKSNLCVFFFSSSVQITYFRTTEHCFLNVFRNDLSNFCKLINKSKFNFAAEKFINYICDHTQLYLCLSIHVYI